MVKSSKLIINRYHKWPLALRGLIHLEYPQSRQWWKLSLQLGDLWKYE
jgi:hypothetical protein